MERNLTPRMGAEADLEVPLMVPPVLQETLEIMGLERVERGLSMAPQHLKLAVAA